MQAFSVETPAIHKQPWNGMLFGAAPLYLFLVQLLIFLADNNNAKVQKVTEKGEHMRLHAGLKSRKAY